MSLTKPSSPSSGTAQKGQMAWNASQPWGMGTCCQNLKTKQNADRQIATTEPKY